MNASSPSTREIWIDERLFEDKKKGTVKEFADLLKVVLVRLGERKVMVGTTQRYSYVWLEDDSATLREDLKCITNLVYLAFEAGKFTYDGGMTKLLSTQFFTLEFDLK